MMKYAIYNITVLYSDMQVLSCDLMDILVSILHPVAVNAAVDNISLQEALTELQCDTAINVTLNTLKFSQH